ncbi:meiotic recombination protein SPO11 [Leptidea sinapis]|uniref:meiotic recombination protein SPO11 n=1 Tax=Leptidea sinapis TaxID=189913 RepID=UPI00212CB9CC|nr:meiotic recombination protein SPO11 [Leptidea sinapis]XP_050675486.1 meiotic recombination protein SPO11 [Leptidea sinapis]
MDLMNKNLLKLSIDLSANAECLFKQDARLVAAIDSLFYKDITKPVVEKVLLPERKLQFSEVQSLLNQTTENDDILKNEKQNNKKSILKKIEDILESINRSAENGDNPKLIIRNQRIWSNCIYDLDRVTLKSLSTAKNTVVRYSRGEDSSRFNTIVFVLTRVHDLLMKNLTVTRREMYYQNVTRFRKQVDLDIGVRDVCCLLETPPWELGVVATAKGLVAGPLQILTRDGTVIDCMTSGGTLIPQDINGIREFKSSAKYILVVEKDAVFQKLLDEGAPIRLRPVIIITGKGYPDVCTRQLLCRLVADLRLKPLALVDADPHGYEIFLTYKYGSLAQSHLSLSLACPKLSLLGARHDDVMTLTSKDSRMSLTNTDKRKLKSLMNRPYLSSVIGSRIKEELNAMLLSGVKAEIESLASTAAALCDSYLPSKIIQGDFLG